MTRPPCSVCGRPYHLGDCVNGLLAEIKAYRYALERIAGKWEYLRATGNRAKVAAEVLARFEVPE